MKCNVVLANALNQQVKLLLWNKGAQVSYMEQERGETSDVNMKGWEGQRAVARLKVTGEEREAEGESKEGWIKKNQTTPREIVVREGE